MKQTKLNREMTKAFKKWVVRRDNGNCQILFALTELDDFVSELETIAIFYCEEHTKLKGKE